MQTFLPFASFEESARVLDPKRLGKQRVETLQILNALTGRSRGWRSHPAVLMWRGHEPALVHYGLVVCVTWRALGYADTCYEKIRAFAPDVHTRPPVLPPWLGLRELHRSHQSALVRKDPAIYRRWFPDVPDDLPYYWPTANDAEAASPGAG